MNTLNTIADIRKDYQMKTLSEADVDNNPFDQFGKWWHEALISEIAEVNAMTLATATLEGKPSARIVLLKGYDQNGMVFFSNYNSHKGLELEQNPNACLVFFWKELERQVRIEGVVSKISADDSDAYFKLRPVESRIGAWSSPQSQVISDRSVLEENVNNYQAAFAGGEIPRPSHWGGYILKPDLFEFWQGRSNRLHDRIQYKRNDNKNWRIERLAP